VVGHQQHALLRQRPAALQPDREAPQRPAPPALHRHPAQARALARDQRSRAASRGTTSAPAPACRRSTAARRHSRRSQLAPRGQRGGWRSGGAIERSLRSEEPSSFVFTRMTGSRALC
jgi:hypothetical protein